MWPSNPPKNFTREEGFELLLNTQTFADSAIGEGGDLSNQVACFRVIIRQTDNAGVFKDLLQRAQLAGQLYALCGLWLTDRPFFDRTVVKFRFMRAEVNTQFGCVGSAERVPELVVSDHPCALRLLPRQSPQEWFELNSKSCDSYRIDIFGGGYSWEFSH